MSSELTLIGSQAMKFYFGKEARIAKDWDYHAAALPDPDTKLWLESWAAPESVDLFVDPRLAAWPWGPVATPDELYTMKISHGYWDLHGSWDKHATDIMFLQRKGCKLIPELHDLLLEIWKERYPANTISLDKSADEFFTDHVPYVYVHDTVHETVAYHDRPWYESYLKDGSDVMVDNAKFWALPLEHQLEAVREEIYVIALERCLIPKNYKGSPMRAYRWALRRVAISLFKNKWATFVLTHLDELARPDVDFVARHKSNAHKLVLMEDS
jgi:hypothetical protein